MMKVSFLSVLVVVAASAGAAEFVVTNFNGSLHEAATYDNNAVPGVDDVIVWTNGANHTLESPLAVKGVRENLTSSYVQVGISGEPLTLGESGVVHEKGTLTFKAPVVLATNQTWRIPAGGNNLNLADLSGRGYSLTTEGNGNFLLSGTVDIAELSSSNAYTYLREGGSISATTRVRTWPGKLLNEDRTSNADLSEILPAISTNLNGIFEFGRHLYAPQSLDVTMTMRAGDRLSDTVIESEVDRSAARLDFGGHTLENRGGEIDLRWSYAYTGAYRQYAGDVRFFYDFVAGLFGNSTAAVNERPFEFHMEGGTFAARRMEIGCGTKWSRPTHVVFAGGTSLFSNNAAHAGISLASANGPAIGTTHYVNPDARLEVTGDAVVNARGLWFGTYPDEGAQSNYSTVTNGYGEVLLTGGTLYIGYAGVRTAPKRWAATADGTNTWTTFRMAGGRLGAAPANTDSIDVRVPVTLEGSNNTFLCENPSGSGISINTYGPLLGTGGFTKTGAGAMRIYGEHLATGKVTIANGTLMYYNPAATVEVVHAETTLPAATYGWTADSLTGNAGTQVTSWPATNSAANSSTFTTDALSSLGISAPTISSETMNGHRTLAFDAASCTAIGLGGSNATGLLGSPSSMTWAFVFRTPTNAPVFKNDGSGFVNNLSALFSRTYAAQKIAVLLRTDGSIGLGMNSSSDASVPFETVWAPQRDTRFNDPHVLFVIWDGQTDSYSVTMDGYTQSSTLQSGFTSLAQSAIAIGMLDHCSRDSQPVRTANHFTGEIAEIRYYRNTVLTLEQRAQLGRELAERYGAPTYGYLTAAEKTNAVAANAYEYEIRKTAANVIGALKGDYELYLGEGQRIWGSGYVNSGLTLRRGAMLDMAHDGDGLAFRNPTSYPPNTHGLTLDGGAVVRFAYHDDGVTSAPTTVSQLTVRGTNVIQVVSTDDKPAPRGVVFQADESMTIEEGAAFVLEGVGNATRLVMDAAAKTVRLETSLGTTIIFR